MCHVSSFDRLLPSHDLAYRTLVSSAEHKTKNSSVARENLIDFESNDRVELHEAGEESSQNPVVVPESRMNRLC